MDGLTTLLSIITVFWGGTPTYLPIHASLGQCALTGHACIFIVCKQNILPVTFISDPSVLSQLRSMLQNGVEKFLGNEYQVRVPRQQIYTRCVIAGAPYRVPRPLAVHCPLSSMCATLHAGIYIRNPALESA